MEEMLEYYGKRSKQLMIEISKAGIEAYESYISDMEKKTQRQKSIAEMTYNALGRAMDSRTADIIKFGELTVEMGKAGLAATKEQLEYYEDKRDSFNQDEINKKAKWFMDKLEKLDF